MLFVGGCVSGRSSFLAKRKERAGKGRKGSKGKEGRGEKKRTNILPKRRRRLRPIRLALKTVKQRDLVIILAEHRTAGCFDGFDGGFGGAGGCYVDWDFELFGALWGLKLDTSGWMNGVG